MPNLYSVNDFSPKDIERLNVRLVKLDVYAVEIILDDGRKINDMMLTPDYLKLVNEWASANSIATSSSEQDWSTPPVD